MNSVTIKNKINFFACLINILCSFFLVLFSQRIYNGIEFDYNAGQLIFELLSFICLAVVMHNRDDSFFNQCNIIRLIRIGSRKKAFKSEYEKIFSYVFLYELIGSLAVLLFSYILKKQINVFYIAIMFLFNFLIKLLIMLIQFIFDLIFTYNFSFLVSSTAFMLLLLSGTAINNICDEINDTDKIRLLTLLNSCNLVNYISIERAFKLTDNLLLIAFTAIALIAAVVLTIHINIKKVSILPKE